MTFRRLAATALVLAGAMMLPAIAMAADAFTTGNVNVRTGPGADYARTGTLAAGTAVSVRGCEANWCNIRRGSLHGWVSAKFLSDAPYRPSYRPPVVIVPPPIVVRPPHWNRPPAHRPPHWQRPPHQRPPHWRPPHGKPPHDSRPPRPPRPGGPAGANCKIGGGLPCPR